MVFFGLYLFVKNQISLFSCYVFSHPKGTRTETDSTQSERVREENKSLTLLIYVNRPKVWPEISEIMIFFFGDSECRKNGKNPILGIRNVEPEPNVEKKIFLVIYPFSRGAVEKWRFFRKTFYGAFFQILVAQFTASPTTPSARPTDRNSWKNTS